MVTEREVDGREIKQSPTMACGTLAWVLAWVLALDQDPAKEWARARVVDLDQALETVLFLVRVAVGE